MLWFWMVAGGLAAGAAALVAARAAAAVRTARSAAEDPALPVYRRQLAELDDLAARGLLEPEERRAAETEAARRLLRAGELRGGGEAPGGRGSRLLILLSGAGAAATALCLYVLIGSPGLADQPFRARVRTWRTADPSSLDPERMSAVLKAIARERPHDPQAYEFLGRAEMASGDDWAAAQDLKHAAALAPGRADLRTMIGEALVGAGEGEVTPQARAAFEQALAIDPHENAARYFIGRSEVMGGQTSQGLAVWRSLAVDLAPNDPRRLGLLTEIERVASGGPAALSQSPADQSSAAPGAAAPGADPSAFIRAMVARQEAELATRPDDAKGWARLVRSYGVLGDTAAQQRALTRARKLFAGRPATLAAIEREGAAGAGPASAPGG